MIFCNRGNHEAFGLLVADVIRHVARAFDVTDVLRTVQREIDNPTTPIVGVMLMPTDKEH